MNEVKDFHPLVAQWLTDNGYEYEHEYSLPEHGRVDFLATHQDSGQLILVEAKSGNMAKSGRAIAQILDYCRQVPNSKPFLAIPSFQYIDKITEICEYYNVELIVIQCEDVLEVVKEYDRDETKYKFDETLDMRSGQKFMRSLHKHPEQAIGDVLKYHQTQRSNPSLDFLIMLYLAHVAVEDGFGEIENPNYELKAILYKALGDYSIDNEDIVAIRASQIAHAFKESYVIQRFLFQCTDDYLQNLKNIRSGFSQKTLIELFTLHNELSKGELMLLGLKQVDNYAFVAYDGFYDLYSAGLYVTRIEGFSPSGLLKTLQKIEVPEDAEYETGYIIVTNRVDDKDIIEEFNEEHITIYELDGYDCFRDGKRISTLP